MVKEDGSNIIQVTIQGEEAATGLVRPDFDLIIIAARYEQRLSLVKVNASYWTIVFFESIDKRSHAVVP